MTPHSKESCGPLVLARFLDWLQHKALWLCAGLFAGFILGFGPGYEVGRTIEMAVDEATIRSEGRIEAWQNAREICRAEREGAKK